MHTIKVNLEIYDFVKNSLIDMFTKCVDARRAFDAVSHPSVVPYNA